MKGVARVEASYASEGFFDAVSHDNLTLVTGSAQEDGAGGDGLGGLTYDALDRPLDEGDWRPLSGPFPTD